MKKHLETLKVSLMKFGGRVVVHADHHADADAEAACHFPRAVALLIHDFAHLVEFVHLFFSIFCFASKASKRLPISFGTSKAPVKHQ